MAQYQTQLPDKRLLAAKLHEFYSLSALEVVAARRVRKVAPKKGGGAVIVDLEPYADRRASGRRGCGASPRTLGFDAQPGPDSLH